MRSQRRASLTVQLVSVTTVDDGLGNLTPTPVETEIRGATFEPERLVERAGSDQAPVLVSAAFNLPGVYAVNADDTITDADDTVWQATGGGTVWLDRTKVPVTQTRSV